MDQVVLVDRPLTDFGIALEDMVIGQLLERRAREQPDQPFLELSGEEWTFGAMAEAASHIAGGLRALGVRRGDHVGLFMPNGSAFLSVYFGMSLIGAVMVPVNTAYRGRMLEHLLTDTSCRVLVTAADFADRVRDVREALPALETVVVAGGEAEIPGVRVVPFTDLQRTAAVERDPEVGFGDVNCVIYTSGTTGPSKGVPITNSHGVVKAIEVIRICEVGATDVIYSPLPLFHSMALLRGVVVALVCGCRCALRERFSASAFWDDVRRLGATVGHCVFTIPQILKKAEPGDRDRDHPLRCLYNARYDAEFEDRFGVRLIEGYGLTEAGVSMYMRPDDAPHPGSCGRVSEDWEVRLADDRGVEVPDGEVGEVLLRPRHPGMVTPGYLNRPEATAAAFRDLWFHTGDLATRAPDGFYTFRDRKKDAIRRRGENISSWEVEQTLREHPAIAEAAALPYPSPLGEDDLRVVVELVAGAQLAPAALIEHCTRRMPDFMVPRYVEIVAELPRTPTGRVEKYRLREQPLGPDCHDRGDPREQPLGPDCHDRGDPREQRATGARP